jgi:hypothetical protein
MDSMRPTGRTFSLKVTMMETLRVSLGTIREGMEEVRAVREGTG